MPDVSPARDSIATRVAESWRRHELVYPCDSAGIAFWPPADYVPGTGAAAEWRVSRGSGTVYATTVQYKRDAPPRHLVVVELDEGFRMLSRIEGVDGPGSVPIGSRVQARFTAEDDAVVPSFELSGQETR